MWGLLHSAYCTPLIESPLFTHRASAVTLGPKNVSAPEEIIFELIAETEFLNGGWEEFISETAFLNLVIFRIRGCIYL